MFTLCYGFGVTVSHFEQIPIQCQSSLNACQKVLQNALEHSAILSAFIKLPFVIKIFFSLFLSVRLRKDLLYGDWWLILPCIVSQTCRVFSTCHSVFFDYQRFAQGWLKATRMGIHVGIEVKYHWTPNVFQYLEHLLNLLIERLSIPWTDAGSK